MSSGNKSEYSGIYPIRALLNNIIPEFENISSEFLNKLKSETDFNGLKRKIEYHIDRSTITNSAWIDTEHKIHLHENYNQFLWTLCYSLLVLFDEGIQRPLLEKSFKGSFDISNPLTSKAFKVLDAGLSLFEEINVEQFFNLPNPEKPGENDKYYIGRANGIFTAAMSFILIHEFAHQYYGHLDAKESMGDAKKEEYDADEYAFNTLSSSFDSNKGNTNKFGIIIGICSIIFFNDTAKGGDEHPDPDLRLQKLMMKMDLDERDNLWGLSSLSFLLWAKYHKKEYNLPKVIDNYKSLFKQSMRKIKDIRNYSL